MSVALDIKRFLLYCTRKYYDQDLYNTSDDCRFRSYAFSYACAPTNSYVPMFRDTIGSKSRAFSYAFSYAPTPIAPTLIIPGHTFFRIVIVVFKRDLLGRILYSAKYLVFTDAPRTEMLPSRRRDFKAATT